MMRATNRIFLLLPCILLLTTSGCNSQQNAIMSNDPNFDPSAVFLDPRWKEMKKVD